MRYVTTGTIKLVLTQHALDQLKVRWQLLFGTDLPAVIPLLKSVIEQATTRTSDSGTVYYTAGYITLVVRGNTIVTILISGYTKKQSIKGGPSLSKLCG